MNNWTLLSNSDSKRAWDYLYNDLHFKPHEKKDLIVLPIPNRTFDISSFYNDGFREELYENLHEIVLSWFKKISNGKRMYALNWQHDGYSFACDLPFEKDEFDEWLVPVFPNGDYLFFLTSNFKNGIFADGIHLRFSIWGEDIFGALESATPDILKSKIQ